MAVAIAFTHFAEKLQAPNQSIIEPKKFCTALNMQQQELSELAGVHRATIRATPENPKLQKFMRDTLRVLSAASEINPDSNQAIYWYRNTPISEFNHQTAESLVAKHNVDAVINYLASSASGSTG